MTISSRVGNRPPQPSLSVRWAVPTLRGASRKVLPNLLPFNLEHEILRSGRQLELQESRHAAIGVILDDAVLRIEDAPFVGDACLLVNHLGKDLLKHAHLRRDLVVP